MALSRLGSHQGLIGPLHHFCSIHSKGVKHCRPNTDRKGLKVSVLLLRALFEAYLLPLSSRPPLAHSSNPPTVFQVDESTATLRTLASTSHICCAFPAHHPPRITPPPGACDHTTTFMPLKEGGQLLTFTGCSASRFSFASRSVTLPESHTMLRGAHGRTWV